MGGFNRKNPPGQKPSWTLTSAFAEGSLNLILGVEWGRGTEVGRVRWQHKSKCRLGSTAVDGFWGVRCLGRRREQSTSKRHPYSQPHPAQIRWRSSGSDLHVGADFLSGSLISNPEEENAPGNSHCPGWWSFGLCLVLAGGHPSGPHCLVFKITITPLPFLSLNIRSWATIVGALVCVLYFPSMWVEDQILLEASLDLPK